ncbi:Trm112 family protein [Arthrobacter sp. NPDC093139]|uniref:Trm112 family protein n=1 Tax=Arthrobacter sp. NPDC093139 TaxID=3363945 RepID=UPI003810F28D
MPKISPELLSVLRCPVTGSALIQEGEELVSTAAGAGGEKLRYAIEDGIPLLLPPELLAAANAARSDQHDAGLGSRGTSSRETSGTETISTESSSPAAPDASTA